jgi:hypothetical protein
MSVRFVLRHNQITYICSDIDHDVKYKDLNENNTFIKVINKDIILAFHEINQITQHMLIQPIWDNVPKNQLINKKFVVEEIIDPFYVDVRKRNLFEEKERTKTVFFIITKDTIFQVLEDLFVVEVADYASMGLEEEIIFPYCQQLEKDIYISINHMMKALKRRLSNISSRYVVYNTKDHNFKIFEGE